MHLHWVKIKTLKLLIVCTILHDTHTHRERERERERERKRKREGGRERGREGEREGGREREIKRGRERQRQTTMYIHLANTLKHGHTHTYIYCTQHTYTNTHSYTKHCTYLTRTCIETHTHTHTHTHIHQTHNDKAWKQVIFTPRCFPLCNEFQVHTTHSLGRHNTHILVLPILYPHIATGTETC